LDHAREVVQERRIDSGEDLISSDDEFMDGTEREIGDLSPIGQPVELPISQFVSSQEQLAESKELVRSLSISSNKSEKEELLDLRASIREAEERQRSLEEKQKLDLSVKIRDLLGDEQVVQEEKENVFEQPLEGHVVKGHGKFFEETVGKSLRNTASALDLSADKPAASSDTLLSINNILDDVETLLQEMDPSYEPSPTLKRSITVSGTNDVSHGIEYDAILESYKSVDTSKIKDAVSNATSSAFEAIKRSASVSVTSNPWFAGRWASQNPEAKARSEVHVSSRLQERLREKALAHTAPTITKKSPARPVGIQLSESPRRSQSFSSKHSETKNEDKVAQELFPSAAVEKTVDLPALKEEVSPVVPVEEPVAAPVVEKPVSIAEEEEVPRFSFAAGEESFQVEAPSVEEMPSLENLQISQPAPSLRLSVTTKSDRDTSIDRPKSEDEVFSPQSIKASQVAELFGSPTTKYNSFMFPPTPGSAEDDDKPGNLDVDEVKPFDGISDDEEDLKTPVQVIHTPDGSNPTIVLSEEDHTIERIEDDYQVPKQSLTVSIHSRPSHTSLSADYGHDLSPVKEHVDEIDQILEAEERKEQQAKLETQRFDVLQRKKTMIEKDALLPIYRELSKLDQSKLDPQAVEQLYSALEALRSKPKVDEVPSEDVVESAVEPVKPVEEPKKVGIIGTLKRKLTIRPSRMNLKQEIEKSLIPSPSSETLREDDLEAQDNINLDNAQKLPKKKSVVHKLRHKLSTTFQLK